MSTEKEEKTIALKSVERELKSQSILAPDQGTIHLKKNRMRRQKILLKEAW